MKTKEYIRPIPATWWLHNYHLILFMIREISSIFIAGYCVFLMVLLYQAEHSTPGAFQAFYATLRSRFCILINLVVLFFAVFHSVTFFNLTPKVLVVRRGEEKVPDALIAGVHYGAWAVVSIVLILFAVL
jgi:fumarate reductase subunit C